MILEFNRSDKYLINSLGEHFTISLEFELETDDLSGKENISKEKFINIIKEQTLKFIISNRKDVNLYTNLVDDILSELSLEDDFDDDDNYEIFDDYIKSTGDKFEKDLYRVIYSDYLTYWCSDNIEYLTEKVKENLPNFYKKWNTILKFELDNTLERGIEFSPKKYLNSIDETLEFIEDFYKDFDNQNYWYMSKRTGIHINIGLKRESNWNILKGFLMISDEGERSFTFKDMEWRRKSLYTKTFLPQLKLDILLNREKIMKKAQFDNLKKLEEFFGKLILSGMEKHGYKNFGFNITRINDHNYVEFRYPGGEIEKNILIDKIYYFCYVVKLMTDRDFKRRQYLNKLYKFISNL